MNVNEMLEQWSKMTFEENPYGDPIPDKFLDDRKQMKDSRRDCLRWRHQDGFVTGAVVNDLEKNSFAERNDPVNFSAIYRRLYDDNKLCPSNYIVEVIKALDTYSERNNIEIYTGVYRGTIARALRSLASFVRELALIEILDTLFSEFANKNNVSYHMLHVDTEEDIKYHTDVKIELDGKIFRVWSYQVTRSGVAKTAMRIRNKPMGSGYNIFAPFDMFGHEPYYGWYLYDLEEVRGNLNRIWNTIIPLDEFRKIVTSDGNEVKNYYMVFVE